MDSNLENLQQDFLANQKPSQAKEMKRYMKDQFDFLGIKQSKREAIARPYLTAWKKQDIKQICTLMEQLHQLPYREYMFVRASSRLNKLYAKNCFWIL